jgi:hypothetical protein
MLYGKVEFLLKPFKNSFPVYICPCCHNYGEYKNIYPYFTDYFCLEVTCSQCKYNVVHPKCICDKHNTYSFEFKISVKCHKYDIMCPSELLWEKQKINYMRLFRFLLDYGQLEVRLCTSTGNNMWKETFADIILDQHITDLFSKLKVSIQAIRCTKIMYNLPNELVVYIYKLLMCQYH